MKKTLGALALVLVLAPLSVFAATSNTQVQQTLVQQLLTEFVFNVNAIQQMNDTIATAFDPTQFSSLTTLLQNQFTATQGELDNLLNPNVPVSVVPSVTQPNTTTPPVADDTTPVQTSTPQAPTCPSVPTIGTSIEYYPVTPTGIPGHDTIIIPFTGSSVTIPSNPNKDLIYAYLDVTLTDPCVPFTALNFTFDDNLQDFPTWTNPIADNADFGVSATTTSTVSITASEPGGAPVMRNITVNVQ